MTSQKSILNPISVLLLVVLGLVALLGNTGRSDAVPSMTPADSRPAYGLQDQVVTGPGGFTIAS